jgi:murein L,D-transpeptidase YcbB/YkuD
VLALPLAVIVADQPVNLALEGLPPASPVARVLQPLLHGDPDLEAFYAGRGDAPIWFEAGVLRPEARSLVALLRRAGDHGLDPAAYAPDRLAAQIVVTRPGDPQGQASLELALSRALAAYASDLHGLRSPEKLAFVDPGLPPTATRLDLLGQVASAPTLSAGLDRVQRMNPIYEELRRGLRAAGPGDRPLILANLERARLLPPDLGKRYLLVDITAASVEFHADGEPTAAMRAGVGRPATPTPSMIGMIRYAMINPYWNVPPDLVRDRLAPRARTGGPAALEAEGFEALSDWSDTASSLPLETIDWNAVASGEQPLRMRQKPGPRNMMGRIKFMLPNRLGIYLHDTPYRSDLSQLQRTVSAGCVRLADASVMSRWLLGGPAPTPSGAPDQRVDLPDPTPVYFVYLTARVTPDGALERRRDIYGRDPALLTWLAKERGLSTAPAPGPPPVQRS